MRRRALAAIAFACGLLVACGGGGGGGGGNPPPAAPGVLASLVSFAATNVPPGFIASGYNSGASVQVVNTSNNTPITDAAVTVNGAALTYVAANQDYEGILNVAPGASASLSVVVQGATYSVVAPQVPSYPAISAPQSGATWASAASNLVAWSGVLPSTNGQYAVGVVDTNGQLLWPATGGFQAVAAGTTSYAVPAGSVSVGNRLVLVGIVTVASVTNAAAGSGFAIGGFSYVPITVTNAPPPPTLVSIAVTPASYSTLAVGGTQQFTATGTYSDASTGDLTTQVTWTSSDTTKATVNSTGLGTGIAYGSATITASLGGVSGSATFDTFQPNPSPAPPLGQSVAYQVDYAHSGYATFGVPLSFPAAPNWSVTLTGAAGYPLIAGGRVYVMTSAPMPGATTGTSLYALDEATGTIVWGPVSVSGPYNWAGYAYDHGTLFVVNYYGLLRSFDAASGQAGWSVQLPGQSAISSPPTAVNGIVYVGGSALFAVDESNGDVLWNAGTLVLSGPPTASNDGVFVSSPCEAYKFDPLSAAVLWHYSESSCGAGGGGRTSPYANGSLYFRDWTNATGQILDGATGNSVGTFTAAPIPALSTQTGYFLYGTGTLQAIDLASHNVLWSFTGDGQLVSAPIVIDSVVIIGSANGTVFALNAATGAQIWSGSAATGIARPSEDSVSQPLTGFGAGEGYLVVPAGSTLTAWHLTGP